jgi:hypothetical protein
MYPRLTWGGVDWFGCDDDLSWERLDAPDPVLLPAAPLAAAGRRRRAPNSRNGASVRTTVRSGAGTPAITRRVLILDVENVCPSSRRPVRAMTRLDAVLRAAGPVDLIVAASAASQHARLDDLLRKAGVDEHLRCGNRPNAADRALIKAARQFAQDGPCEVIVASNDHGFRVIADLPGVQRLVLITHPHLATARSLLRVASELRVAA